MLIKKANFLPCNFLAFGRLITTGRNSSGVITVRHRGGATVSRVFRVIDFFRYV
jgi:ribosomal protein L2